jgi:predicted ATPase
MLGLIAATWLARLAMARDGDDDVATLRDLYETFTEGFDTLYLREAREVLEQAGAQNA